MESLLEALILFFDSILTIFSDSKEPQKKWVKVVGLIIALIAVLSCVGLAVSLYR